MKIAVISGIDKPTVRNSKGGVEVWTANFVAEQAKRNHQIDLYSVRGSLNGQNIQLLEILDKPLADYYTDKFFTTLPLEFSKRKEQLMATIYGSAFLQIKAKENEYDIIVDSCSYPSFTFNTHYFRKPTIIIGHFPLNFATRFYFENFPVAVETSSDYFVFPSQYQFNQASFIPQSLKVIIPHGIDSGQFRFDATGGEDMVWLSRFHHIRMDKGLKQAIVSSSHLKKNLKVFVFIEQTSRQYFDSNIKPLMKDHVFFHEVGEDEQINRNEVFGSSKLFLFPIQWEEPFGLVMLESMASGTPIIAFARGSVPEIIEDGKTGFIVNPSDSDIRGDFIIRKTGMDGLYEAIDRIYGLSVEEYAAMRKQCRERVEQKFSLEHMVDGYEQLYKKII
ncbi:MAG: glycosyltransferase [Patescibacteria group bacterium]